MLPTHRHREEHGWFLLKLSTKKHSTEFKKENVPSVEYVCSVLSLCVMCVVR